MATKIKMSKRKSSIIDVQKPKRFLTRRRITIDCLPNEVLEEIFRYLCREDLNTAPLVCKRWFEIVERIESMDIMFVVDITGSSSRHHRGIILCLKILFPILQQKKIRLGFVGYRDHPEPVDKLKTIEFKPLTSPKGVIDFMNTVLCQEGADEPEAVLDGLDTAAKACWKKCADKHIILICDAIPHGTRFGMGRSERFPDGCPCGLDEVEVLNSIRNQGIKLHVLGMRTDDSLDLMRSAFQNVIPELSWRKIKINEIFTAINQIFEEILDLKDPLVKQLEKLLIHNEIITMSNVELIFSEDTNWNLINAITECVKKSYSEL